MKKQLNLLLNIVLFAFTPLLVSAQGEGEERLGLPGDQLNLAAVLDIFRASPTIESFEAALNSDTSKVNNLDLNMDNRTDYIRVISNVEGATHTIVLQTYINNSEKQDIAVIFVEKKDSKVTVQIVGDEELYGKDYIIEPSFNSKGAYTPNPAYQGDEQSTTVTNNYYYDSETADYRERPSYCPPPSDWVIITFMFGPLYRPWVSPWYWGYYPGWWTPWTPWYWDTYYYHWYYQHTWYGWWYWRTPHPRFRYWYGPYHKMRQTSNTFINNRSSGRYENYYRNPRPENKPVGRAVSPSHNISIDRNPAVIRQKPNEKEIRQTPVRQGDISPQKDKAEPKVIDREPVKPVRKTDEDMKQEEPIKKKTPRKKWFNRTPSGEEEQRMEREQQKPRRQQVPGKTEPKTPRQPEKTQPSGRPGNR